MSPVDFTLMERLRAAAAESGTTPGPGRKAASRFDERRLEPGGWSLVLRDDAEALVAAREKVAALEAKVCAALRSSQVAGASYEQLRGVLAEGGLVVTRATVAKMAGKAATARS